MRTRGDGCGAKMGFSFMYLKEACMQAARPNNNVQPVSWSESESIQRDNLLLPELHHCAGQIGGVYDAVVGVASICVPRVATAAPRKFLHAETKPHLV